MIYAGLVEGEGSREGFYVFWCVTCQRVTVLLLGMDVSLADLEGFLS